MNYYKNWSQDYKVQLCYNKLKTLQRVGSEFSCRILNIVLGYVGMLFRGDLMFFFTYR